MISFLKTVLIILLVYLGLKYLLRWLSPYIMRFVAKKVGQRFERSFGQNPFQSAQPLDQDDITIKRPPKNPKATGEEEGEYVDFEEIE